MSKSLILMRDVICLYHPEFRKSKDLCVYGMKHPDIFNVERLIEESLAALGPYEFVDQAGYDFTDYSDSKTTTVAEYDQVMAIGKVESKIGALRITIYNPFKQACDFMFIPYIEWQRLKECNYGKAEHTERLRARWNSTYDHYNRFEDYRVGSFKELACATG